MEYLNNIWEWIKTFGTPYPRRDWMTVLGVCSIIGIILIGFAGYIFFGIQTGSLVAASVPEGVVPAPSVSRAQMTKVLAEYGQRATNYNAQNIPTYTLFDPHLIVVKK